MVDLIKEKLRSFKEEHKNKLDIENKLKMIFDNVEEVYSEMKAEVDVDIEDKPVQGQHASKLISRSKKILLFKMVIDLINKEHGGYQEQYAQMFKKKFDLDIKDHKVQKAISEKSHQMEVAK